MNPAQSKSAFVMMPFASKFQAAFEGPISSAIKAVRLSPVRADQQHELIVTKGIQDGIEEATLCIADLSGLNPNVIYEVAYAISKQKPIILITQDSHSKLPFDIRHFRVHKYAPTETGFVQLEEILRKSLKDELEQFDSPMSLLRSMLLPRTCFPPKRCIVAASPLSWRQARQGGGFKHLRRTSSDHVGIRGLFSSFGLISGLENLPELVDPGDYDPHEPVYDVTANIYCIGSPKANAWTAPLLSNFCKRKAPAFSFRADPESENLRDVRVSIHMNGAQWFPARYNHSELFNRQERDFGLIIRGPHPSDHNAMFLLLAGRSAIGTEAACRAVTEPNLLQQIVSKLRVEGEVDLNDHRKSFWAFVLMEAESNAPHETKLDSFKVLQAEYFTGR